MPIPLPNLDDRAYPDLVAEAQALMPALYPAWTNHNPTDPGIVLVELLAWLTEMVLYRLNEIPKENTERFLQLLNGAGWTGSDDLEQAVHETVLELRDRYRAVSGADFEYLALTKWPATAGAITLGDAGQIQRVHCVPRRNLAAEDPIAPAPGHVSLVIVPPAADDTSQPQPSEALCQALWAFLDERRLLTMRHHVVGPSYVKIKIEARLFLRQDALPTAALLDATKALAAFFHPLHGGEAQSGWPFGRDVYASELYALLNQLPLVDHVAGVNLTAPDNGERHLSDGVSVIGISLEDHELVGQLDLIGLAAVDFDGNEYYPQAGEPESIEAQEDTL